MKRILFLRGSCSPVARNPRLADDFRVLLRHHCAASSDIRHKGIFNDHLDANGLKVHHSTGYRFNLAAGRGEA